jgi:hypothetical protein
MNDIATILYEKITVTTGSAVGLTNLPERCSEVLVIVETNDIRYRTDGTDPTSTTGMPMSAGQNIVLVKWADISRFKAIAVSATAYLSVEYKVGD